MELAKSNFMKNISAALLCSICFASNACADNTLQIKPEIIEVFKDARIIALADDGKYQIGNVDDKWSAVYNIEEKGLSILDSMATTDSGVFLIGDESHSDTESGTLDNTYYTGLIVLIDSNNKTLREWRSSTSFLHVSEYHNQLTLTSFDGIYTLKHNGDIELIEGNDKRKWLTSIRDDQGKLILCNSLTGSKDALFRTGPAGCARENNWSFDGWWYPSDDTIMTTPIACGPWLIESIQKRFKSPLSALIVRDMKSGRLIKKMSMPDFQRFFCINDSEIMANTGLQSFTLPEMKQINTYSCNENETILSIKEARKELICLTVNGHVGRLKKNK